MLLNFYYQSYQGFLAKLQELQKEVIAKELDLIRLKTLYKQVEETFQTQMLNMTLDELDCNAIALIQSAETEIYKNLRLLGTELLFLGSARQARTKQQRLNKVQGIIEQLINYTDAIIQQLDA
ncbi:MAG: heterocyst frequency control protein PatD [Crocosphaera sp.]|nr:heterocyst frequency control protein PatD [Crocosphaera sp.]